MADDYRFCVAGFGAAFPGRAMSTDALASELRIDPAWIESRCGIRNRFVSASNDTTESLAASAAARALASTQSAPDLLICTTFTPDHLLCPTAPAVAKRLGLSGIGAFDINGACSGGVIGLLTAQSLLCSGIARRILLVCSDTTTKFLDPLDAKTRILFGDGSVALVLDHSGRKGFITISHVLGCDGSGAESFYVPSGGSVSPSTRENGEGSLDRVVTMDGRKLFRFAVETGAETITGLCQKAKLPPKSIDHIVVHQANLRIIHALQVKTGIDRTKWVVNISRVGNLASASTLLGFIELMDQRSIKQGQHIILASFGAGLTWAGMLLKATDSPE